MMLIDEATIENRKDLIRSSDSIRFRCDPAGPPAPDRRRRLHDAGRPRAPRRAFPTRTSPTSSSRAAAPVVARQPAPRRGDRRAARARPRAARSDDLALGRRLRAGRYDLAIDFHGGPRASLLTWLSGAPDAHRLRRRRAQLDVHAARRAAARAARRVTRSRTSGICSTRARHRPAGSRARIPVEMPVDAAAARGVAERLARAGVARRRPARSSCTSARATRSGDGRSRRSSRVAAGARRRAIRRRRIVVTSGTVGARRGRPRHRRRAGALLGRAIADAGARVRRVLARRAARAASIARRSTSAATADRCTSRRRASVPIVGLYGPTLPVRSAPWRAPTLARRVGGGRRPAVPAVRPAVVRARRLPLPDLDPARSR